MDGKRVLIETKLKVFLAKKKNPDLNEALTPKIQQELIERLIDGTTCAIVDSLKDLQHFKESELLEERENKIAEIKNRGGNEAEEMKKFDLEVVRQIDELVMEQQNHLSCAHVPLFKTTSDPKEIKIQMEIFEFISSLTSLLSK
uniref:Uncharacterized protein n=1 Tax=Panagrolaimus superbus TaxID=310955 RepID=A0A914XX34_9BILA